MSLLWRQPFRVLRESGQDQNLLGSADYIIKTECDLIPSTDFCPCVRGWYIATFCLCETCGYHSNSNGIGPKALFPAYFPSAPSVEHDAAGEQMFDSDGVMIHKIPFNTGDWPGIVYDAFKGDGISCVRHQVGPAPFQGEIHAKLYLNGAEIASHPSIQCSEGDSPFLGMDPFYDSPDPNDREEWESDLWRIQHNISDKGVYILDLQVKYIPTDTSKKEKGYTLRVPIRVHDLPANAGQGSVVIIPDWGFVESDECRVHGLVGTEYASFYTVLLKGPFKTKDMAEDVYSVFKTQVDDFAAGCACLNPSCGEETRIGYSYIEDTPDPISGLYKLESFANQPEPGAGCGGGYMGYSLSHGTAFVVIKTLADGKKVSGATSGTLAPCEYIEVWSTIPWDNNYTDSVWGLSGDKWTISSTRPPCKFCENNVFIFPPDPFPSDCVYHRYSYDADGVFWLSDWDYTPRKDGGPHGIPGSTEQYLDYTGEVLIASMTSILLGELPEGLA